MTLSMWTDETLQQALAELPPGWFMGAYAFRQAAIRVLGTQAAAEGLRKKLLERGAVEGVRMTGRAWRYRKLKELA